MNINKMGVHIAHCCVLHGCKYGDKDCPVENGIIEQKYPCESCDYEGINSIEDIKNISEYNCPICGKRLVKDYINSYHWYHKCNKCNKTFHIMDVCR